MVYYISYGRARHVSDRVFVSKNINLRRILTMKYGERVLEEVKKNHPNEKEFIQAATEVPYSPSVSSTFSLGNRM